MTLTPAARKLGEQPAFPINDLTVREETGLTKREYLIASVLAGSMHGKSTAEAIAESAIMQADATLNALAEEQPEASEPAKDLRTVAGGGTLKLQIGRRYRSMDGKIDKIIARHNRLPREYEGASGRSYMPDGRIEFHDPTDHDLIELVESTEEQP